MLVCSPTLTQKPRPGPWLQKSGQEGINDQRRGSYESQTKRKKLEEHRKVCAAARLLQPNVRPQAETNCVCMHLILGPSRQRLWLQTSLTVPFI